VEDGRRRSVWHVCLSEYGINDDDVDKEYGCGGYGDGE